MNMREKIARAICAATGSHPDTCVRGYRWVAGEMGKDTAGSVCYQYRWQDFLPQADAALSALETPTPDMIEAGQAVDGTITAEEVWSAMIRKAKEG